FDALPIGRNQTVAYARDLDGDGVEDRVVENQRVRASFSGSDGRWMEWVWTDSNTNFLPASGSMPINRPSTGRAIQAGWEFQSAKIRRTVSLGSDNRLTVEQDQPLPPETLKPSKRDGIGQTIERLTPNRSSYRLDRSQ